MRSDAAGLPVVGAGFPQAIVTGVRINLGTRTLRAATSDISAADTVDLVVTDNSVNGEPKPIE